jgi:methylthioribose-1-phosphate isomerase
MRTVEWKDGSVRFLDQTRLPDQEVYRETTDYRDLARAIRHLEIRGAPAIGVAAAYGMVLAARAAASSESSAFQRALQEAGRHLASTRPTAVNLFAAISRLEDAARRTESVIEALRVLEEEARALQREDEEACTRIARLGASLFSSPTPVLTHCNAGALATAGTGTALGVIVQAWREGHVTEVYVDETRPLLQGARLTAWELLREGIPMRLITDNSAGIVLASGRARAIVVGADRIAANGDTANKVGTYPLAVLAHRHGLPFYVAAPVTTLDPQTADGSQIPIEERDPSEVTHVAGNRIAPLGVEVFAPAFDVTPHELISAIVTDRGIVRAPFDRGLARVLATRKDEA